MSWAFVLIIIFFLLVFIYAMWRGSRLPKCFPNNFLINDENYKEIVICCGDSITHGRIGYDWVSKLEDEDKSRIYINAGINGDLAWNLYQRIEEIINCNPDIITILIGTNDAMGSQSKKLGNDYIKMKKLPQRPSIDWYQENYDLIISKLMNDTNSKIYLVTLPWIGEKEDDKIIDIVKNHNTVIEKLAKKHKLEVIPFFDKIDKIINANISQELKHQLAYKYMINYKRLLRIMRAIVLHYIFGFTWNKIGNKYILRTLCDFIHLNENGGLLLKDLIQVHLNSK
ncbi:uncharacterized protein METZ01_LOCUS291264 [marine metagenome]|jgi:lysophospholipase L1-like esterase|uniref:SGNH hydrolase-type esterase domain-containing protein n=1 Tax=marine metagenome TaxID=408172 RepID=A0A382LP79_9ZZZZ|tara:strand:+ start:176 stop:1027 length:852 start_codon:yes stop_codon:yes gene_type:complete